MHTASRLFYVHGYHATGVDRIIAEANVSKGSFFYQFKSKEELAISVLDWHREKMLEELQELTVGFRDRPRHHLLIILSTIARKSANYNDTCDIRGCIFGNFAMEMSVDSVAIRHRVLAVLLEFRGLIKSLLVEAKQLGELPTGFDCDQTSGVILCLIQGAMLLDKAAQESRETNGVIRFVAALLKLEL